ncbi:hypothetical protein VB713_14615 [Anabaena cylindrica UHCC 0172]|nr:hypothetical protein [Anabaena cylindrica]MEA5552175.1 hypothetical protein [Anabaena cylindrica UHCC 0172]
MAQVSQIQRIAKLIASGILVSITVNFSPPLDYSDRNLDIILSQL